MPSSKSFGARLPAAGDGAGPRSIFKLRSRLFRSSFDFVLVAIKPFSTDYADFFIFLCNLWMSYALNASTILKREARIDGNNDPINPITPPKSSADSIKSYVTRKLNAISLNVTQFDVPVETKFNGNAKMIPITAPINAIATDSNRNAI